MRNKTKDERRRTNGVSIAFVNNSNSVCNNECKKIVIPNEVRNLGPMVLVHKEN